MAWQVATCALLIAAAHASCNGNDCSAGEDGNALLQTKASMSIETSLQEEDNMQDKTLFQTEETGSQEEEAKNAEDEENEGGDKESEEKDQEDEEDDEPISEIQDGNSGPATGSKKTAYLSATNRYRCMHGVPKVKWDSKIASGAYRWISTHGYNHASMSVTGLGENLYWSSPAPSNPWTVVKKWYNEVHSCYWPGCSGSGTGHFTALIWKNVYKMGCAQSGKIAICRYKSSSSCGPNCGGRYTRNVKRAIKSYSACKSSGGSSRRRKGGSRRRKGGGNLKNCAANSKTYCFGYKSDGSWCWLTHDGKSNFVKDGDNGYSCSSYNGYPSSTYCKGAKSR